MSIMRQFQDTSYLFGGNAPFVEQLYEDYLDNPQSVPEAWRDYFDKLQLLPGSGGESAGRGLCPDADLGLSHARPPLGAA